ncbi:UDP-glucuronic acid decarboxylase 1 [Olea europaea subsp. europaea]|uniref:UDP-glucuronate decarboxylase n=1 Tax=Olea europaea subsp. europaea TaxID=158383 RepID=A0A8S0VP30_OLEEU|nr:UDP-glucuronic acid decarboxylase 1 [Olea europaea subsp. europaea]
MVFTITPSILLSHYDWIAESDEPTQLPRRIAYELRDGIGHHCADPLTIFARDRKTNVMGTLNMLGLAKRVGARFLLTSTSEVYGDPLQHPQAETYWGNVNPIGESAKMTC